MIYGLAAALGWGLSDLWAAISGRRIGSGRTVVVAQVAAAVVVTLLVLIVRPDLSGIPTVAPWLIPNAFLGAAAFATLYKGLELGPIAVVSPVLASYAVVPVLLSVVLLGETLGGWEVVGVAVTIAGAALTSTDPKALRRSPPPPPRPPRSFFALFVTAASPPSPPPCSAAWCSTRPGPDAVPGDRDGDRRADPARGRLTRQTAGSSRRKNSTGSGSSGVVPRIRSAAFSATIITGA